MAREELLGQRQRRARGGCGRVNQILLFKVPTSVTLERIELLPAVEAWVHVWLPATGRAHAEVDRSPDQGQSA